MLEAYRMFAYDRGWVHRCDEAVLHRPHGRSRRRARAVRHPRAHAAPDRPVPARAPARSRRSRQPPAAPIDGPRSRARRASSCRRTPIIVARSMGPAALLDYDRKRLRGLVLEEGGPTTPCRHRRPRPRHPRCRRNRQRHRPRRSGRCHHCRRRRAATCTSGPPPDIEAAYAEQARLRARRQEQYAALREKPASPRTA